MKSIGKRSLSSFLKIVLDVGWYVVVVSLGLAVAALVLCVFVDFSGGNGTLSVPVFFELDAAANNVASPSLGIEGAKLQDARANLRVSAGKGGFLLANLSVLVVLLSLVLWLVTQLRRVFRTLRDGQPFAAANVSRIRQVGWAVILGELARAGTIFFESYYASTHFTVGGIRFVASQDINVAAIFSGLVILIIAEVFREGTRLDEEQSLTV